MKQVKNKSKNRGFTLVELIVVLVILAILAAILVPALLGYIDSARTKQDVINAKNLMNATQAELTNMYAHRSEDDCCAINGLPATAATNGDFMVKGNDFAKNVFATADETPYMFMVGLGDYDTYIKDRPHVPYTCYFAVYWATKDSDPVFFNGSEWVNEYPWTGDGNNTFDVNGTEITLQFYALSSPSDTLGGTWWTLQQKVKPSYRQ